MRRTLSIFLVLIFLVLTLPALSFAHGVIGQRFFPESVTVLDPFPADEMDLLAFSHQKDPDSLVNAYGGGISKRLSPNLSFGLDWEYDHIRPNDGSSTIRGFNNVGADLKYNIIRIPEHEFLATVALAWDIGGSGQHKVTGDSHSAWTPEFLFGYGFGDLPDGLKYLKPFAVTGQFGITSIAGRAADTTTSIKYGFVLEYSLLYLQSSIKDIGIGWPLSRIVPMVEFAGESPFNGPDTGQATATAYPGFTWAGKYYQMSVEAIMPLNKRTGSHTGVQALLHLYLDDIFPRSYTWTPFYGILGPTQR